MSDSRFPIGSGYTDLCKRCLEKMKQDVASQIADELEKHPEILNGNNLLHDLVKLRRGQHDG